jgi:solute carrier family 25 citrate transporter 1
MNPLLTYVVKPPPQGVVVTAVGIVKNEGLFSLYRGLGAVLGGIIPKMAIRFTSYEYYKLLLTDKDTMKISRNGIFLGKP